MKVRDIKRELKQQETEWATFRKMDPQVRWGFKELAVEPLAMLESGDVEGAVLHIQWLRLDNEELELFWTLFDSTQRAAMKAMRVKLAKKK